MKDGWKRYKVMQRCPCCLHGGRMGHGSGCCHYGPPENPYRILCLRVSEGSVKAAADGMGYVHNWRNDPHAKPRREPKPLVVANVDPAMAEMATRFEKQVGDSLGALSSSLGVTTKSLQRLRTGWADEYIDHPTGELVTVNAYSFPMRSGDNLVVGVRFRNLQSAKWAARGSANGLFVPTDNNPAGLLCVVEGPTETAAMLDWGFSVVGRPSNTAGADFVVAYAKRFLPRRPICIIRNNDPEGSVAETHTIAGAETLADRLKSEKAASEVSIIHPPTKDMRDYLKQGAIRQDVEALIREALV